MAFIGRLHPLLIHFPIVLVLLAAGAELVATATANTLWRRIAVGHIRIAAAFALIAAIAGWELACDMAMDATQLLEWHRWLAIGALIATFTAALVGGASDMRHTPLITALFRTAVFAAAACVVVAAHLGGVLVWGADFLRP